MNRLGSALLLGAGVTVTAVVFGSRPLGVIGIGLLLAAISARAWVWLVDGPLWVDQAIEPSPATEGDRVRLTILARRASRVPVASFVVRGRLGRLGAYECRLRVRGRTATGQLDLGRLPRGKFPLSETRFAIGDFLGLESVSRPIDLAGASVVVYPRLVALDGLFTDSGRLGGDGRRLLLRRPAGFDFHSVREYEQGESLRRVHWPSSARRGQLMVKELEDTPRDAVVVLLDCDPAGAAGQPPASSFDTAVRAAGSVLRAYAERGRTATLVTTGKASAVVRVRSVDGDLRAALDVLAAAEPDAPYSFIRSLGREQAPAARAGELVVVTAALEPAAGGALLGLASRRLVSVVWIDAASFAGRPTRVAPGVLRLAAEGIPVAVVRSDEDLAAALDRPRSKAVAHA